MPAVIDGHARHRMTAVVRGSVFRIIVLALLSGGIGDARAAYDDKPFDSSAKRLPESYLAHDVEALATALRERRIGPKDEFETTDQARARIRKAAEPPLLGSVRLDSLVAFRISIDPESMLYDADSRRLRFNHVVTDPKYSFSPATLDSIYGGPSINPYITQPYDDWHWRAWQEVGRRQVEASPPWPRYTSRVYGFTLCKRVSLECRRIDRDFFSAKLEPDVARQAKLNTSYLVIGRLAEPWVSRETRSNKPNVQHQPYIITSEIVVLRLQPTAVWIYNDRTGDVYKRLELGGADRKTPAR